MIHTSNGTQRADSVCHDCKLRKKACDKTLPACGFCSSRGLRCKYDTTLSKGKIRRAYNPGKYFVLLESPSAPFWPPRNGVPTRQHSFPENQGAQTPVQRFCPHISSQPVEDSLNQHEKRLIELINLTYDDIIDYFFRTFHTWLPVISRDSLCREASWYREEGRNPPADFTVLLLAMSLVVTPPLSQSSTPRHANQEFLYNTVKSAFSQAQTSFSTSLRLIQAAFLIALREYLSARLEAAYISMMTCTGLARVSELRNCTANGTNDTRTTRRTRLETAERENVAWAISMLERLILCEMGRGQIKAQTEFPNSNSRLASDLDCTTGLESMQHPYMQGLDQVGLSFSGTADTDQFGRQKQLVILLDRLLFVRRLPINQNEAKLAELAELDNKLRNYLEVIMAEMEWKKSLCSVPVAICVRLLFLLHGSILDTIRHPTSERDRQKEDISWIGLDTACRMMLDVVHAHSETKPPIMPICCFYNLHATSKWMQERNKLDTDMSRSRDIVILLNAEERYREMWVF